MKLLTVLLLLYAGCSFGQTNFEFIEFEDERWADGKITLNDGTELKGLVKYDNKTGEIAFSSANVTKLLTPRNVLNFEFTDPKTKKQRFFYYLEITEEAGNSATPIFEVLRAYDTFAVLSRVEPVQPVKLDNFLNQHQIGGAAADPVSSTGFTQRETIWFLPADGKPTIYLDLLKTSYFRLHNDKIEDKDIFEKCTGSLYPAIKSFARRNNLSFANKHDLLTMLDFYELQLARK